MKRGLLIVSLCLNLALGITVCWRAANPPRRAILPDYSSESSSKRVLAPALRRDVRPVADPGDFTSGGRFTWASLESDDYTVYIANLRAIGCPPETIADIIAADLEANFATRSAAVPAQTGFWTCGPERERAELLKSDAERTLEEGKHALFNELCGSPWPGDGRGLRKDLTGRAIMRFFTGPVSDSQLQKVYSTAQEAESRCDRIRDTAKGLLLPEDEQQLSLVNNQTRQDLRRILSSAGYEEFHARVTAFSLMDKSEFRDFEMTSTELREICRIRNAVYESTPDVRLKLFETADTTPELEAEFHKRLKAFLGAARFAQLGL